MWRSIKSRMKSVNAESDVLAALISAMVYCREMVCVCVCEFMAFKHTELAVRGMRIEFCELLSAVVMSNVALQL